MVGVKVSYYILCAIAHQEVLLGFHSIQPTIYLIVVIAIQTVHPASMATQCLLVGGQPTQ